MKSQSKLTPGIQDYVIFLKSRKKDLEKLKGLLKSMNKSAQDVKREDGTYVVNDIFNVWQESKIIPEDYYYNAENATSLRDFPTEEDYPFRTMLIAFERLVEILQSAIDLNDTQYVYLFYQDIKAMKDYTVPSDVVRIFEHYKDWYFLADLREKLITVSLEYARKEIDYYKDKGSSEDYSFILSAVDYLDALFEFLVLFKRVWEYSIDKIISSMLEREYNQKKYYEIGDEKTRFKDTFKPEQVETVYHASAWAKEILRDGFSKDTPSDRAGLGGFGRWETISVTTNQRIAFSIARSLKEIILIVHGEVTSAQIIDWMVKEKIWDEKYRREHGSGSVKDNLELYNKYLWMTKARVNPVFVGLSDPKVIKMFQTRTERDVGVLKLRIDMTNVNEYIPAENEFRITAKDIISIESKL